MFSELLSESRQLAENGDLAQARAVAQQALDSAVTDAEIREADVWITDLNGRSENRGADVLSFLDDLDSACRPDPLSVADVSAPAVETCAPASPAIEVSAASPLAAAPQDPLAVVQPIQGGQQEPPLVSQEREKSEHQEKAKESRATINAPQVCVPSNVRRGGDPDFEAYQRQREAIGASANATATRQAVPTEFLHSRDKAEVAAGTGTSVQIDGKAEPPRDHKGHKGHKFSLKNRLFGAPALLTVAAIVASALILQPWRLSAPSDKADASTPTSGSGFPELELRQPRREQVSTGEISSKLSAPEKTKHQEALPSATTARQNEPEVATATSGNRENDGRARSRGLGPGARTKANPEPRPRTQSVTKTQRDSRWTTNATIAPISPHDGAVPPRRLGSRFFSWQKAHRWSPSLAQVCRPVRAKQALRQSLLR